MTRHEDGLDSNPRNTALHRRIQATLIRRYDKRVMNNVYRADYLECLVALTLGADWWLTWAHGWDWAAWDCQHTSGARLEVKQSAARQSWDRETPARRRAPRFDIALRAGDWTQDGSRWVDAPGRPADLYVRYLALRLLVRPMRALRWQLGPIGCELLRPSTCVRQIRSLAGPRAPE